MSTVIRTEEPQKKQLNQKEAYAFLKKLFTSTWGYRLMIFFGSRNGSKIVLTMIR